MSELSPRAIPKSATRARPSSSIRTFCGFRSRWTIPLRCAKRAALRIWRVKSIASWVPIPPLTSSFSCGPVDVLHRDEVGVLELAAVEDADHVRVLEAGRRLGLAAEALDELLVLGEAVVEDLDRDLAIELGVVGEPDVGHPARADLALELVALVDHRPLARRRPSALLASPSRSSREQDLHHLLRDRGGDVAARSRRCARPSPRPRSAGSSAGAKPMNQAWLMSFSMSISAVPVLPATWIVAERRRRRRFPR